MEKKTIGGFIAALRKANGMTQKDLAERLNVSDKTVSRWERDDGAPDLAVIPALAEIFGVTCDELLRGERRSPVARAEEGEPAPTPKGEKERRRLLALSLSRYKTRTYIAMGISGGGLIAAMVGNLGFLRGYVGFLIGTVFYLASVICQAVFVNGAFFSVSDESLDGTEVGRFKWAAVKWTERSLGLTAVLLGFSLPLVLFSGGAYSGLELVSWCLLGLLFGGVALVVTGVVCWCVNGALVRDGICILPEGEDTLWHHNHELKRQCVAGLAGVLAATVVLHIFGSEMLWSASALGESTVFEDYESFVEYMEQDIPYDPFMDDGPTATIPMPAAPADSAEVDEPVYYDEFGNEISEEEALRVQLTDRSGEVVCEYIRRNETVASVSYSAGEGTVLPITVRTYSQQRAAQQKSELISTLFCVLYPVELLAGAFIYFRKRER